MRVLIVNLCKEEFSLDYNEFVLPIMDIVSDFDFEVIHFLKIDKDFVLNFDKIILCGTNILDFFYLENLDKFLFLRDCKALVLGICAGAQVIGKVFGLKICKFSQIGFIDLKILENDKILEDVNFNEVYSLHQNCVCVNDDFKVIAKSFVPYIFKLKCKGIYGVLFHPEVRNKKLILNFLNL